MLFSLNKITEYLNYLFICEFIASFSFSKCLFLSLSFSVHFSLFSLLFPPSSSLTLSLISLPHCALYFPFLTPPLPLPSSLIESLSPSFLFTFLISHAIHKLVKLGGNYLHVRPYCI